MPKINRSLLFGTKLLLHLAIALLGAAIIETIPWRLLPRPHSINVVIIREAYASALISAALGFFVYRRWRPDAAKWVGLLGLVWLGVGFVLASSSHASIWQQLSGQACKAGLGIGCTNYFVFTVPMLRAAFYSLGAWLCWRLRAYGDSALEDALVGQFRRIEPNKSLPTESSDGAEGL